MAPHTLPQSPANWQISKHGVLVLWGFGIKVRMDRDAFLAEWGVGLKRYQVRLSRVEGHKLRRVVLIGSDGYFSLEALRFITDVGASLEVIDKRGKALMVCSPVAPSVSKLRRAQSLALTNGVALAISKEIISEKLADQAALVRDILNNPTIADTIARIKAELSSAESIEAVRLVEARGSKKYWSAWTGVAIRWARKDERRVPNSWKIFSSRISPLTHSPRLAADPMNACMNLIHTLCESECRIALCAMGLDPDIGMLHVDTPNRSSLACDLQEIVRSKADAFVLNFIQNEVLRKADFWEDRQGCCRLSTALAGSLCQTSDIWRRFVEPKAEWIALKLHESINPTRSHFTRRPATRLTQQWRREVKGSVVPVVEMPKPAHVCRDCGAPLRRQDRDRCARCAKRETQKNFKIGRKEAQNPNALAKRTSTMQVHKAAIDNWNPADLPAWLNRDAYSHRIVPALAHVPLSLIRSTLGISEPYARWIKDGKRIPHARHWAALAKLVGIAA